MPMPRVLEAISGRTLGAIRPAFKQRLDRTMSSLYGRPDGYPVDGDES